MTCEFTSSRFVPPRLGRSDKATPQAEDKSHPRKPTSPGHTHWDTYTHTHTETNTGPGRDSLPVSHSLHRQEVCLRKNYTRQQTLINGSVWQLSCAHTQQTHNEKQSPPAISRTIALTLPLPALLLSAVFADDLLICSQTSLTKFPDETG